MPCPLPPCHRVTCICTTLYHRVTASQHYLPQSFALPPATKPVSHLPCPLPPNQSVICLAPCHQTSQSFALPPTTASLRHCVTAPRHRVTVSLCHRVTTLVSHLPCPLPPSQSVICLAPCHQTSQSFALPCPLHHHATTSLRHCHHVTVSPHHLISQSFALPPPVVTALVSHLPCPLPPSQSVICLAPCHQTTQSFALPLPPNQSVICLAPYHRVTASPRHRATASPHHCISQSFALPPATKPVSHLPCPLPPNQSVICLAPCHQTSQSFALPLTTVSPHHRISQSFALPPATKPVSHLPCPLPPNQSVICLAPCHQTSQSFALPPHRISHHRVTASPRHCITAPPHHRVTASPRHCLRFSPPHGYESDWLMLTNTVLIG